MEKHMILECHYIHLVEFNHQQEPGRDFFEYLVHTSALHTKMHARWTVKPTLLGSFMK